MHVRSNAEQSFFSSSSRLYMFAVCTVLRVSDHNIVASSIERVTYRNDAFLPEIYESYAAKFGCGSVAHMGWDFSGCFICVFCLAQPRHGHCIYNTQTQTCVKINSSVNSDVEF